MIECIWWKWQSLSGSRNDWDVWQFLLKAGPHLVDGFDRIILVDAPRPIRLERLVRDRGLRETEAMAMIAQQMPADLKRARADFVIDNDATLAELEVRVDEVWRALVAEADALAHRDSLTLAPPRG